MRIAVAGSHATGKSTLVTELARRISELTPVEEPYYQLLAAGHAFGEPPTIDDFETLFDASVASIDQYDSPAVVFDRSPADYLAYLIALQPHTALVGHVAATRTALETLDLLVYVPIERPDRIADPERPRLRHRVDRVLRDMLVSQTWGWTIPCVEVRGTLSQRVNQVARHFE
jgi:predicted ATPase